ncbi:unnamed protein product [Parnassius apollo]|uniref:(apollo) hypothetical protein n=1 Tax=Parnassius apollo TaxID=110799 RepID=A0A8S3WWA4_PARAO|nr:unnamed protein product [Parnassius apollo]
MRKNVPAIRRRFKENVKPITTEYSEIDKWTVNSSGDEERLRARKVWSRWGKWSDCSASCGGGSIIRRRLCVAGRCAPGEFEEQRRPCAKAPCAPSADVIASDDLRETE